MKKEIIARFLVIFLIMIAIAIPFIGLQLNLNKPTNSIIIHGRMPENGGWSVSTIYAEVGRPIRIKLTSDDVVHGFAIGKYDQPALDIMPGEIIETTLKFDKPGTYTFYCTRWCGPNHWRMRGTIEVSGVGKTDIVQPPLYLRLGINIDAPHLAEFIPLEPVSTKRGSQFAQNLPDYALEQDTYFTNSPTKLWKRLRAESTLSGLSDIDLWDAVAWIWQQNISPEAISAGQKLYAENCAACHGETGKGDGIMVRDLPAGNSDEHDTEALHSELNTSGLIRPYDFTDPEHLLGASPALLAGKIIRGGMGTGMPYWGPIFTNQQIDDLVSYLFTFAWSPSFGN